jgi:hypothetical protein
MDDLSAERVARNEALFRAANERIDERARASELRDRVPFLCECAEPGCTEIVQLATEEYERIRADPTWFLNAPGHNAAGGPATDVVERHDGYEIVCKVGRAAEVAAELNPRRGAETSAAWTSEHGGSG